MRSRYGSCLPARSEFGVNKMPSSWIEYLSNKAALEGSFNGRVPELGSMVLAQMVLGQCNELYISLTLPALPEGSPARWIAKSYNQLQLRLSFYDLAQLSITGGAHEGNLDVLASFLPGRRFSISNSQFNVEFIYGHAKAGLYPFDSRIFEEPRQWFHR
jgi:hypothetical protein